VLDGWHWEGFNRYTVPRMFEQLMQSSNIVPEKRYFWWRAQVRSASRNQAVTGARTQPRQLPHATIGFRV
jgi:hypothetical protein